MPAGNPLVRHDLRWRLGGISGGLLRVDLHLVALHFLLLLDLLVALTLDVLATVVGQLLFLGAALAVLDASHLGIAVVRGRGRLAVCLAPARTLGLLFLLLLGRLVGAVLVSVRDEVGLGLLRRELGWGRGLRIPVPRQRISRSFF